MAIITRFAPSPTGYLHLGGARTALFNWLYARHHGGKFRLRIEDTDRKRSSNEAIDQILNGLKWLGVNWDDEVIFQFERANRHREIALKLLDKGRAYKCYSSPEELQAMREKAKKEGNPIRYDGTWRDKSPSKAPSGINPVIRFRANKVGETIIEDGVQGTVCILNSQIDDMILLRADGTPTYMLSVVVDDHDMGITDTIRGDDHLNNAARQTQLFEALNWNTPRFSHIPLIHGMDGSKLSKRHGAVALDHYESSGVLPEAMKNYLLRLGWSKGDNEIISEANAIQWFSLGGIGKSASRFDLSKLSSVNAHYMRESSDLRIADLCRPKLFTLWGKATVEEKWECFLEIVSELKLRAKNTIEVIEKSEFIFISRPIFINPEGQKLLLTESRQILIRLIKILQDTSWETDILEETIRNFALNESIKLGKVAQPLRAALTGSNTSPGIFILMSVLGKSESLGRLRDVTEI